MTPLILLVMMLALTTALYEESNDCANVRTNNSDAQLLLASNRTVLYVGLMMPMSGSFWAKYGLTITVMVQHTFDYITARADPYSPLSDVRIDVICKDTKVMQHTHIKHVF